jgi:Bacterial sugar transferase
VKIEVRFDPSRQPVVVQGSLVLVGALLQAIESAVESMPDGVQVPDELPFSKWLELDLRYIENWSLLLDLKILFRTIPAVLRGTGPM